MRTLIHFPLLQAPDPVPEAVVTTHQAVPARD
jgi:hypothetical protein